MHKLGVLVGVLAVAGCPSDDAPSGDTDTDTDTDGMTATTPTPPTTSPSSSATIPTPTPNDESSTTDDETTFNPTTTFDPTTGGTPPAGICLGIDEVGNFADVSGLDGAAVDPACDSAAVGCGGDPTGEWTLVSSCGFDDLPNQFDDLCPGATQTASGMLTGTRTFNEDMTFEFDTTTVLTLELNLDSMACFGIDCAALEMSLTEKSEGVVTTCTDGADDTCDCTLTNTQPAQLSGTWAVEDTALTITTDEDEQLLEFCVETDRLELWTPIFDITLYEQECDTDAECLAALGDMSEFYVCAEPEE